MVGGPAQALAAPQADERAFESAGGVRANVVAMDELRVAGAQLNVVVGDVEGNAKQIGEAMAWAESAGADLLVLSELALSGYPPEDLVLRDGFVAANLRALDELAAQAGDCITVVGFVDRAADIDDLPDDAVTRGVANAAAILHRGAVAGVYHKVLLPNYGVFDESRYFARGGRPAQTWRLGGLTFGVSICEDAWVADGPPIQQAAAGARLLVNINASPYNYGKALAREDLMRGQARAAGAPLVYVNQVGGQDELVFDGHSMVFSAEGRLLARAPQFVEDRFVVDVALSGDPKPEAEAVGRLLDADEEVYRALELGVGDYVRKNGFDHVVIGLSGGIDSALTAAVCADALGPDRVWGVAMPSRYSSPGSVTDAEDLAGRLGIRFTILPMDEIFQSYLDALAPIFDERLPDVTEENIQARIRGALLMALSNKFGGMVVATGNKSEMAVGYATLYGDMAGGYAVLKDVFKTLVYRLARWRNTIGEVIPPSTISKPPSAELAPDQRDSDSLPPYDVLDAILERYIEEDRSIASIVGEGYDEATVARVARMVDRNEYKRRQSAPGVKITAKAFGKDRRLPITNRYRLG